MSRELRTAEVKWVTSMSPMCLASCLLSAVSSEWLFSIKEGQLCVLKRDLQMEFTQCHDPWSIEWQDVADSLPSARHTHTQLRTCLPCPFTHLPAHPQPILPNVCTCWAEPYKDTSLCLAPGHTSIVLLSGLTLPGL